jgi:hypothetical protein
MYQYLRTRVLDPGAPLHNQLQLCKAARVLSPTMYRHVAPADRDLEGLSVVLTQEEIAAMRHVEHAYSHAAANYGVNGDQSILQWYAEFASKSFPAWGLAAKKVFTLTASSASVERTFSKLSSMFNELQSRAHGDYIESALLLRINNSDS